MDKRLELLAELLAEEGIGQESPDVIPRRKNPTEFPLSFNQRRLWLLSRLENGIHYNDHFDLRLTGQLDVAALGRAIEDILTRHEVMRCVFPEVDGAPLQTVMPPNRVGLPFVDLAGLPETLRMLKATELAIEKARKPFDLGQDALWRFVLVRVAEHDHLLLITAHHIAIDGWSRGVFLRELSVLYPSFLAGGSSPLKDLPIQYADYAAWHAEWVQGEAVSKQIDYWRRELAGVSAFLTLPTDRPRPASQSFRGARHWFTLSSATTAALKDLSQRERSSLFMTLLAVLQTLLNRYTGQEDILVWTPVANRMRKELEDMIGYFLNMLVLRGRVSDNLSFRELLQRVRESTLGALANQDVPLEKLIEVLRPERTQRFPLFQVLFVLHNVPMPNVEMSGVRVREFEIDSATANFDLTISLTETADGLSGRIEYATDLFDPERIERMAAHFQTLIDEVCANPGARLSQLPLMTAQERNQLIEWNRTVGDCSSDYCIHELFEREAHRTPDRIALEFRSEQWTYAQLDARSNRIAERLQSIGVKPGELVGLCMEASPQLVASVLGILKAGAAYVHLDPAASEDQLALMLKDAQPNAVIADSIRDVVNGFDGIHSSIICVNGIPDSGAIQSLAPHASRPEDLACVTFVSASDGPPSGVEIEHRSLSNLLESIRQEFGLAAEDVWVTAAMPVERAAVELLLPLIAGARVVLADQETTSDGYRLARLLKRSGATAIQFSPATLRLLIQSKWKGHAKLKLVCRSEERDPDLTAQLLQRCGSMWNIHGAAETAFGYAANRLTVADDEPLGRPIANMHLHILDKSFQPVPIGIPGEVCVRGAGVARGYRNRPEMTGQKFVPDLCCGESGARLYRTGDLARFRSDGQIEFLGRMDDQRKAVAGPSRVRAEGAVEPVPPRDMLEQQLVKIWESVLRVRSVSVDDNFFDLGGHSLTAVLLFSEIRKQTGRNLPLATLFQAPTVKQLAGILRKDGWVPQWSSLVPIQPGGARPPFYCVHGGGGNVLLFRDLASRLGPEYPFFGLQSQGLDGKGNYLTTVQDMAVHYLKQIRELQPEGPYHFGGFCMGGAVAYHMAQLLLEQGQQTKLLVFFDTYNHNGVFPFISIGARLRSFMERAWFHWSNVTQLKFEERIAYLREKLKGVKGRTQETLIAQLAVVSNRFGFGENNSNSLALLEEVNDHAGFAYKPKPYPGKITLFQPHTNYHFVKEPCMGWEEFSLSGVEVIEMPVYPGGLFVEPYVSILANRLRECIDAVNNEDRSNLLEYSPSRVIQLGEKAVHLWRVRFDEAAGQERELVKLLSHDEYERAERFLVESARKQFVLARGVLRDVLSRYSLSPPHELRFAYTSYGKPYLEDPNPHRITFNLAHSDNIGLIAVSCRNRVGVDIECTGSYVNYEDVARATFSFEEAEILRAADSPSRERTFFEIWTRKEAHLKAIGEGFSADLRKVSPEASHWTIRNFPADDGYIAAIAIKAHEIEFDAWHWSSR